MRNYNILSVAYFCSTLVSNAAYAGEVGDLITKSEESGATAANEASKMIDSFRKHAARQSGSAGKIVDSLNNEDRSRNGFGVTKNQGLMASGPKPMTLASARKYPKQGALKDVPLPHEGRGKCNDKASQGSGKCSSTLFESMEKKQASGSLGNTQLLIFVSQSVPADSIKELWNQAHRVGGKLVFRGLVGGSFKETQSYIQELGIVADIDSNKFEEFEVIQVPAFVLSKENKYDKMVGNISLSEFLEQSSISGDLKEEAAGLYKKFQGEQP